MQTKIELLAPARDLSAGRAAIDCGADAVYIGGPAFGARHAAGNSVEEIAALVRYARPFGVRIYVTLNTLLFDAELAEAESVARALAAAGVDAFIVQDMAWVRIVSGAGVAEGEGVERGEVAAGVELHASTQTANVRADEIAFLGRVGFSRVILERALSIDEIRKIRAETLLDAAPDRHPVELEAFVHGAICVGRSGRCFLSRAMGAGSGDELRSGNRGTCSQPCRLTWDLVSSDPTSNPISASASSSSSSLSSASGSASGPGLSQSLNMPAARPIIIGKHLLSVRDLDLSARLGELLDAGVTSLKIEGRLKDIGYVRNIVGYYNTLLNKELSLRPGLRRASVGRSVLDFVPSPAKSFTRGATEYFFDGSVMGEDRGLGPLVASFDTPKAIGEPVGQVVNVGCDRTGNRWFILSSSADLLSAGDGICFLPDGVSASLPAGVSGGEFRGTNINRAEGNRIYPNDIQGIAVGTTVCRNFDHAFARTLERSRTRRKIDVTVHLAASAERVAVRFVDETGLSVEVARAGDFEPARNSTKMLATAREELARSGETIFQVTDVQIYCDNPPDHPFIPVSVLAALRREGLQRLLEARETIEPQQNRLPEDLAAKFPCTRLTAAENVTNNLAEQFYRDHGVTEFEPALELCQSFDGEIVMRAKYCLRRELGQCLRRPQKSNTPPLPRDLFLEHGRTRLRLDFDCENCEMTLISAPKKSERI